MARDDHLLGRVRVATTAVVPKGVKVKVEPLTHGVAPTFEVIVRGGQLDHRFVGGWAGEGWPADVERFLGVARKVDVVYANRLSEGAQGLLETRRLGWVDEAGNASISLRSGLIVSRQSREVHLSGTAKVEYRGSGQLRGAGTPTIESDWTRTMVAAAEAILAGTPPAVEVIEAAAGISRGSSSNALTRMEKIGLLDRSPAHRGPASFRRVVDQDRFLAAYASAVAKFRMKQPVVLLHRTWRDPLESLATEIGPVLSRRNNRWAVTGAAASTLLAPYLTDFNVVELYVDAELFAQKERLAESLGGRIVGRGHRIEVRSLPTAKSDAGPTVRGIHVALPARVYADLLGAGGRYAEAAQHLKETHGVGITT